MELPVEMNQQKLQSIRDYSKQKRYDIVAIMLTKMIYSLIPFNIKDDLNTVLIGEYDYNNKQHKKNLGYLGFKLFNFIDKNKYESFSQKELRDKLKDVTIIKQLKILFEYSQNYLIKPIVNDIKEFALKEDKKYYQSYINRKLRLDKLDGNEQKAWITHEFVNKLIDQGIIDVNYTGNNKSGNKWFTPGKNFNRDFITGKFVTPLCKYSKLHERCFKEVSNIIKEHPYINIVCEYKINEKFGYKGYMRIDIAVFKYKQLLCCIEADGKQHYEYVPHFHRNGITDLIEQNRKDKLKDDWVKKKCGIDNIRVKYSLNTYEIKQLLKSKIMPLL